MLKDHASHGNKMEMSDSRSTRQNAVKFHERARIDNMFTYVNGIHIISMCAIAEIVTSPLKKTFLRRDSSFEMLPDRQTKDTDIFTFNKW